MIEIMVDIEGKDAVTIAAELETKKKGRSADKMAEA